MRKLLVLGSLVALLVPVASHAQVSLGLRIGFAPAMGDAAKDSPLKDMVKSQIPIQLDAMYKVTPAMSVGGYFSYGFAQMGDALDAACDAGGTSCSASNMRLGVQAAYAFNNVSQQFTPWAGAGIGYEWQTWDGASSVTTSGFEFLNLQLGGDYKVSEQFAVGPYIQFSIAQYSDFEGSSVADKGVHEWFGFGLRGKFDL